MKTNERADWRSRVWLLSWGLVFLLSVAANFLWPSLFHVQIALSRPYVAEGLKAEDNEGHSFTVVQGSSFPIIGYPVSLRPDTRYEICLPVDRSDAAMNAVVDVAGTHYDSPNQEQGFRLERASIRRNYCFYINSESPPADTGLRVMLDWSDSRKQTNLLFEQPRISEVKFQFLQKMLRVAAIVSLCSLIVLLFLRVKRGFLNFHGRTESSKREYFGRIFLSGLLLFGVWETLWVAFASPYPWVYSDEYTYAWLIKHGGDLLGAAKVGLVSTLARSSLYFKIYESVYSGYADPYVLNKVLNVFFWFFSAFLAFITARRFLSSILSLYFAALVLLSPWVIYSRLMMPEVLYFAGVWVTIFFLIWTWREHHVVGEVIAGLCLAALSLVKSHAVFLVPAMVFSCMAGHVGAEVSSKRRLFRMAASASAFLMTWAVSKSILSSWLTEAGVGSLVAGGYGGEMNRVLSLLIDFRSHFFDIFKVGLRHLAIVCLAVGPAVLLSAVYLYRYLRRRGGEISSQALVGARQSKVVFISFVIFSLISVLFITVLFTVSVAGVGVYETLDRVHTRYYGFILPMVILAGVVASEEVKLNRNSWRQWAILGFILLLLVSSFSMGRGLNANDGPDALFIAIPWVHVLVFGLAVIVFFVLMLKPRMNAGIALIALGILVFISIHFVYRNVFFEITSVAAAGDEVGRRLQARISESDRDVGVVFSRSNPIDLYRVMYYLNSRAPVVINGGDIYAEVAAVRARGIKWVLVSGYPKLDISGFSAQDLGSDFWLYVDAMK